MIHSGCADLVKVSAWKFRLLFPETWIFRAINVLSQALASDPSLLEHRVMWQSHGGTRSTDHPPPLPNQTYTPKLINSELNKTRICRLTAFNMKTDGFRFVQLLQSSCWSDWLEHIRAADWQLGRASCHDSKHSAWINSQILLELQRFANIRVLRSFAQSALYQPAHVCSEKSFFGARKLHFCRREAGCFQLSFFAILL